MWNFQTIQTRLDYDAHIHPVNFINLYMMCALRIILLKRLLLPWIFQTFVKLCHCHDNIHCMLKHQFHIWTLCRRINTDECLVDKQSLYPPTLYALTPLTLNLTLEHGHSDTYEGVRVYVSSSAAPVHRSTCALSGTGDFIRGSRIN